MTLNPVLILPLLALLLAVFTPIFFGAGPMFSTSIKSRRRRKVLIGRLACIVLPIAALVTIIWPSETLNSLLHGCLISAVVLVPAVIAHWVATAHFGNQRIGEELAIEQQDTDSIDNPTIDLDPERAPDIEEVAVEAVVDESSNFFDVDLSQNVATFDKDSVTAFATDQKPRKSDELDFLDKPNTVDRTVKIPRSSAHPEPLPTDVLVSKLSSGFEGTDESAAQVQEQLNRVSELVQSHDLGNKQEYSSITGEKKLQRVRNTHNRSFSKGSELITVDVHTTDLSTLSAGEMSQLVTHLRKDKARLQKLVIAQQSVLESEREAHDQSRVVARDAIKIMRDARNAQKFAEKMARRERSERKRIEQQYQQVTSALNNAMSIIEARKNRKVENTPV